MKLDKNIVYYTIVKKENIVNSQKYDDTTMALIILKKILNYLNIEMPKIKYTEYGKPFFDDKKINFNYSHSLKHIVCAVSIDELGADIEETNRKISDNIANRYLEKENNRYSRIEQWVIKEAYSKMNGLGILIGLQNINIEKVIKENKNLIINNDDYVCCIFCKDKNVDFKNILFNGENCYE